MSRQVIGVWHARPNGNDSMPIDTEAARLAVTMSTPA